jgi:hypothetical protein
MNTPQRASKLYPFLASLLTALAFFLVLSGVAYADSPPQDQAGADPGTDMWLVLDPAMSEEEAWPVLAQALSRLKMAGQILDFNPRLQRSAPDAVPAAFVVASPDAH